MTLRWYHWLLLLGAFAGVILAVSLGAGMYLVVSGHDVLTAPRAQSWLTVASELGYAAMVLVVAPFRRLANPLWGLGGQPMGGLLKLTAWGVLASEVGQRVLALLSNWLNLDLTQPGISDVVPRAAAQGMGALILSALGLALLAPLAEEYLFRGAIFRGLRQRWPFWAAALVSAAIFGSLHAVDVSWQSGLALAGITGWFGLVNAYLTEQTGSIWPAVVVHVVNNALATAALAAGR